MSDAADSWTRQQRLTGEQRYNEGDYDPVTNPCGLDADGHVVNLPRMARDMGEAAAGADAAMSRAETAGNTATAWLEEVDASVQYVDASTLRLVGVDRRDRYISRRAVRIEQDATVRHTSVASSRLSGADTLIVLDAAVATASAMRVFYGQDPNNAPKAASAGAKLYIAERYGAYQF